uniref:Uncharacterized protein n=1 Tax=Rhizophora mucronata TaxID=61149 RepID=A0A2P2LJP0_RHIMU
MKALQFLKQKE